MRVYVHTQFNMISARGKKSIFQIKQFLADSSELMIKDVWVCAEKSARMRTLMLVSLFSAKMQPVPVTANVITRTILEGEIMFWQVE